ncbi:hypothetical protein, partial [Streptomyces ziwulingensis]
DSKDCTESNYKNVATSTTDFNNYTYQGVQDNYNVNYNKVRDGVNVHSGVTMSVTSPQPEHDVTFDRAVTPQEVDSRPIYEADSRPINEIDSRMVVNQADSRELKFVKGSNTTAGKYYDSLTGR